MRVEHGGELMKEMYLFRSDYHVIFTELKNKVALTDKDDKRFLLQDKYNTLAWGHHRIQQILTDRMVDAAIEEELNRITNQT